MQWMIDFIHFFHSSTMENGITLNTQLIST
jgi:hypothetical protein